MKDLIAEQITYNTRIAVVQCSYSVIFMGQELNNQTIKYFKTKSFLTETDDIPDKKPSINDKLYLYLLNGIINNRDLLDKTISKYLKLDISKNDPLLIAIIRAGCFEILFRDNTHNNIIVSEYTTITKSFFNESKTAFANAILDKIAKASDDAEKHDS